MGKPVRETSDTSLMSLWLKHYLLAEAYADDLSSEALGFQCRAVEIKFVVSVLYLKLFM